MQQVPPPDLRPYFRTIDDLPKMLVWQDFFRNKNPVELDIGCGRGLFLVNSAQSRPHVNYLGLEIDYCAGRRTARRLKKRELPNARVVGGDCRIVLNRCIPQASVSAVHVYFPDPWWKKKHRPRRLFTDVFVDQLVRVLEAGGFVHCWTDVDDYFNVISALMNHDARFATMPPPPERESEHDMDYQTSFERKKRKSGLCIRRGMWRKRPEHCA